MGISGILVYGESIFKGREAESKGKPSLLNYFCLEASPEVRSKKESDNRHK